MLTWAPGAGDFRWLFCSLEHRGNLLIALLVYCDETGGGLSSN